MLTRISFIGHGNDVRKLAVIGSRKGVDHDLVVSYVEELFEQEGEFILVSGGGTEGSVNHTAEQAAMALGIPVISFRPKQFKDYGYDPQFGVEEWRLAGEFSEVVTLDLTWADWISAVHYRSMLIASRAESATAFHHKNSRGTQFEIELFAKAKKPCKVIST